MIQKSVERDNLLTQDQADCTVFNHELVTSGDRKKENIDKGAPIYLAHCDTFKANQGMKFMGSAMQHMLVYVQTNRDIFKTSGNIGE